MHENIHPYKNTTRIPRGVFVGIYQRLTIFEYMSVITMMQCFDS